VAAEHLLLTLDSSFTDSPESGANAPKAV
jgi:hypothetical protein